MRIKKSPIFYSGNKTKLLKQIIPLFPKDISTFYDLFSGSGVVSMNVKADKYILNDSAIIIQGILKLFKKHNTEDIHKHIINRIQQFNLSKTNKQGFNNFKTFINTNNYEGNEDVWLKDCFVISFYSFSNILRWSKQKLEYKYNVPFGKREYKFINTLGKSEYTGDKKTIHIEKIENAVEFFKTKDIKIMNEDTFELIKTIEFSKDSFVYLDPPYFGTDAVYNRKNGSNKGWSEKEEFKLLALLELLDKKRIKFAMSNVLENKGHKNTHLEWFCLRHEWNIYHLNRTYAANGKGNAATKEVLITNFEEIV